MLRLLFLMLVVGLWAALNSHLAIAEPVQFDLTPSRCIALQQGQKCYQKIALKWQLPHAANVCVWLEDNPQPLMCWQNLNQGLFNWEFQGDKNIRFKLVDKDTQQILGEQQLVVAWVYKANSRRESHWRLF